MLTWAPWALAIGVETYAHLHDGGQRFLFTGTRPDSPLETPGADVQAVAVLPYGTPAFHDVDETGRAAVQKMPEVVARADGTPTWFRVVTAEFKPLRDGDIPDDLRVGRSEIKAGDKVQAIEEWLGPKRAA